MAAFKLIMSSKEGVIHDAFGGKNTPGYLLFYPQGISQYTNATKTTMPMLAQVVFNAATKYKADLSPTLVATLQGFQKSWEGSRDAQEQLKGDVKNNIADKSGLRPQLSIALSKVVHGIAYMFPSNVHECMSYFNFTVLYPPKHHKHEKLKGNVAAGDTVTAVNETLEESTKISVHNPSVNAAIAMWLAADETEKYTPGKGIVVQPGKTENDKAGKLGDLKNTFLCITNLSDVNEGGYEVDLS